MLEFDLYLMNLVIFTPAVFGLGLLFFPRKSEEAMRWWTLFGTAITLGLSICMLISFYHDTIEFNGPIRDRLANEKSTLAYRAQDLDFSPTGTPPRSYDWLARIAWIPQLNIDYYIGIDGISMPLILLTSILCFLAMIASWKITQFVRGYCILFLLLETGLLGTFMALDFFLFYVFWEVVLLPMYFLIGIWGGTRREYAALKFFLYTLLGSVFLLFALLGFYFNDLRDFVHPDKVETLIADLQSTHPQLSQQELSDRVQVRTFDMLVLERAGKATLHALNGSQASTIPVIQYLNSRRNKAKEEKNQVLVDQIEKEIRSAEEGFKMRLEKQWFFQPTFQIGMFACLLLGFAIKVPIVPFHTWLPDAHVEAPTPISMILAGVLLKLGGYGVIRFCYSICPYAAQYSIFGYWLALLGLVSILYGAFAALAQVDFKKLVAYSSISHMGYAILGIALWGPSVMNSNQGQTAWSWGMNGALFQMVAHGITSAGMFFIVGVLYERAHHRNLDHFRGLYEPMPLTSGMSAIIFFAAMGLPGLCGFWGEVMVVLGTWSFNKTFAILAALTVVITAAYILWAIQRVFLGHNDATQRYEDMNLREVACILPLVILSIVLGIFPALLLNWIQPTLNGLINSLSTGIR